VPTSLSELKVRDPWLFHREGRREGSPDLDHSNTPDWLCQVVFSVLGVVDFDVASNPYSAVRSRRAYFNPACDPEKLQGESTAFGATAERADGLFYSWGDTWFCNPPYSNPGPWVERCRREYAQGSKGIAVLRHDHSTKAWKFVQGLFRCELDRRVSFPWGGRDSDGAGKSATTAVLFARDQPTLMRFTLAFEPYGEVLTSVRPPTVGEVSA